MENQTRFDLDSAMESWRQELAAQPNLSLDTRRELEIYLRDTVSELQGRGLNNEESFWLARRRIGQPEQSSQKFIMKANSAGIWRERIFWVALACLMLELWRSLTNTVWRFVPDFLIQSSYRVLFYYAGYYVPIFWVVVSLATGRMYAVYLSLYSRLSIMAILVAAVLLLLCNYFLYWIQNPHLSLANKERLLLPSVIDTGILIALIIWLMPKKRITPKHN
jgi:hypothetical protein